MAAPGAWEHCRRLVAEHDKDRFWASLYAPADRRDGLYTLYAFDLEIAAVPARVREPMAGEIRLQWWREVLDGQRDEEAAAHPVAAALLEVVRQHRLPVERLTVLIDVCAEELYEQSAADDATGRGTIIALAAAILGGQGGAVETLSRHAGLAQAYAGGGRPADARRELDAAGNLLKDAPPQILPALLPLATVGASLARTTPLPLWRRQWLIFRAAHDPRRIFR
jgi:phytoene synthase